jgi:hypothetical protein
VQAQNVLMKRLGITSSSGPPDSIAFQRFLEVFADTVPPSQCEALDELVDPGELAARPTFAAVVEELEQ